jgi:putative FmdB family regulatory protein
MPTYEFRCPDGHTVDKFFRKISDAVAEIPCPVCGKVAARQISGGSGLLFKGSGFYLTDYGKNAHRKGEPANGKPSGDGGSGGSEGKSSDSRPSETKSEAKSESKSSETKSSESKSSSASSSGGSSSSKSDK